MKTLIVYYSMSGNCEHVADILAEKLGADTLRVEPEKAFPDSGLKKFLYGGKSAMMGEMPPLVPYETDLAAYDRVIIGFPVWASRPAPPMRTFIRDNLDALKSKRLAVFACQSGNGAKKAIAKLEAQLNIEAFDAELILIDPKARPNGANDTLIEGFCRLLEATESNDEANG
ncbi:MAG: flavodoxin [Clostridia bacterium]|nr:flavodoxin [Clostridia bacterium]MBP5730285.1 flavodoxin [Clostridia bacterium]